MTDLKKDNHFIPRFWIRFFANDQGHLFSSQKPNVPVSASDIMIEEWIYTVFNENWIASNYLEDVLAVMETIAAPVFRKINAKSWPLSEDDRNVLYDFIALQACRHPDVLHRGYRLAREQGELYCSVHDYQLEDDFANAAAKIGIPDHIARADYQLLLTRTRDELATELEDLKNRPLYDPELPIQKLAIAAKSDIATMIHDMDITLLDAPINMAYVLGDTPLPQSDLGEGFTVPLSKSVAFRAVKKAIPASPATFSRKIATADEVFSINQIQRDNSLHLVIGPDRKLLH